jgi:hypothetical protein
VVTHCFVDAKKADGDLGKVKAANVPIFNPIFLNDYLTSEQTDS